MAGKDCCKIDIYGQLRKDIYKTLCPEIALSQLDPKSWAYATSRKRVDEIIELVKLFIETNATN